MKKAFYLLVLVFLWSCTLDDDQRFVPATQSSYFLLSSEDHEAKEIWEVVDSSLIKGVESSFGIQPSRLRSMAGIKQELWLGLEGGSLLEVDLESLETIKHSIEGLTPHFLTQGEDYILICDTVEEQLGFFHRNNHELFLRSLPGKPRQAVYRSGKFFIPVDSLHLLTYHERGLSLLDSISFPYPIIDLQSDNRRSMLIHLSEGNDYFLAEIDWNNGQLVLPPTPTPFVIIRNSPFFRSSYEKELTRNVYLNESGEVFFSKNVKALEVDFLESRVFLVSDSIFRSYHIRDRKLQDLGIIRKKLEASYFYIGEEH